MRKLIESTFVALDGSIGAPHVWGAPYWDEDHAGYATTLLFDSDALLLGRRTFESFAEVWPMRAGAGDAYVDRINALPKYVASQTLKGEQSWNGTVIDGDLADGVAALKEQPGENILKFGTGSSDKTLLENKLVDEYHFWVHPVIAGGDDERLGDGFDVSHLKLVDQKPFPSGIVVLVYAPK
ncbi:dihydrofolate reductase family protein [Jiangella gansuensis]|uniref:dihydrofolate reductase family protein n=1 Tax=Jiangella gansuensis TaxID=281473 RepID=UPI00047DF060|nr:dihydrofolate reductase family protein [Jiangella gansuensis]